MKYNYHSHTTYCNHSKWQAEELILKAIDDGFIEFGISEHIFLPNRDNNYRLKSKERTFEYIQEVTNLKHKYQDQIKVLVGLEVEGNHSTTGENLVNHIKEVSQYPGVDYIIMGHHYFSDSTYVAENKASRKILEDYVKDLEIIFKEVKIACLAHPDLMVQGNQVWDENMEWVSQEIINLCIKYDIPMGLNINAIYLEKLYPTKEFWKLASKTNVKCILELDTHSQNSWKEEYIAKAYDFAKECGIELIEKLDI